MTMGLLLAANAATLQINSNTADSKPAQLAAFLVFMGPPPELTNSRCSDFACTPNLALRNLPGSVNLDFLLLSYRACGFTAPKRNPQQEKGWNLAPAEELTPRSHPHLRSAGYYRC